MTDKLQDVPGESSNDGLRLVAKAIDAGSRRETRAFVVIVALLTVVIVANCVTTTLLWGMRQQYNPPNPNQTQTVTVDRPKSNAEVIGDAVRRRELEREQNGM